jgi:hypothetical protein
VTNGFFDLYQSKRRKNYLSHLYDKWNNTPSFTLSYLNDEPMAVKKTAEFSTSEQELAAFAKALSHPARIAILKILADKNACICGTIVEVLPLAQSTVSQHLKELKNAGLISGTVEGPKSCYCINWEAFEKINSEFSFLFSSLSSTNNNSCC